MGLIVRVLRSVGGGSANGGVSEFADRLCVVNVNGPFEPARDMPAVRLETHHPGCLRLVPLDDKLRPIAGTMAGGNFATTSDSRFGEACRTLLGHEFYGAVAIHDRKE